MIDERAALLRWMFEVTDDGLGQHSIAAQLNETKVDTWGAGKWKAAYWHPHTSASSSPTRRPSASSCHTKGDHVYLVCSAAHAKSGTCRYESVPYRRAVDAFMRSLRITIKSALRDNDTADMEAKIEQLQVELDAGKQGSNEHYHPDKSRAARQALQRAEHELDL